MADTPTRTSLLCFTSLRDVVIKQAVAHGEAYAAHWVDDEGKIARSLSFSDLKVLSFSLARYLKNQGVECSDRVALIYPPSLDFIIAFLACQVLRAVPISIPHSTTASLAGNLGETLSILNDAKPALTLLYPKMEANRANRENSACIEQIEATTRLGVRMVDAFDQSLGGSGEPDEEWEGLEGSGLSFIQYTSRIIDEPKGVMVSQQAIMNHLASMKASMDSNLKHLMPNPLGSRYKVCNWTPHWSYYGLVAGSLWGLYEGATTFMMSRDSFAATPLGWMKVMTENQINVCFAPSYAFESVVRTWKALPAHQRPPLEVGGGVSGAAWDFTHLCQLHAGDGPVEEAIIKDFFDIFGDAGLNPISFGATYGMAEHVGAITIPRVSREPLITRRNKVTVGEPMFGATIKIVDPNSLEELQEDQEGEIWVSSGSVAEGYWGKTDVQCEGKFHCFISGQENSRTYLRTGDLGFLYNSKLFVTGQLDDVLIRDGKRLLSTDIEDIMDGYLGIVDAMVLSHDRSLATAASSLVYLAGVTKEVADQSDEYKSDYCSGIAQRITATQGLDVSTILLLDPGTLPKTSTGKPARATARSQFLAAQIASQMFRWDAPPKEDTKQFPGGTSDNHKNSLIRPLEKVKAIWENVLRIPIGDSDHFYELGGSFEMAAWLTYTVQMAMERGQLSIRDLFENPTLEQYGAKITGLSGPNTPQGNDETRVAARRQWLWDQVVIPANFVEPRVAANHVDEPASARTCPKNAFLTGGTGVVGSFVLAELLGTHNVPSVYCLVRATTVESGHERLASTLRKYGLWNAEWAGRILPVIGDLTFTRFGMTPQAFVAIADDINLVLHCGGSPSPFLDYSHVEAPNVAGTKEALRLALSTSHGVPVPFHYVSTLAVFDSEPSSNTAYLIESEAQHPPTHGSSPGFSQTKWVAEQLIQRASRDYNIPATIYRLGSLLGHSVTGASFRLDGSIFTTFPTYERLGVMPKHPNEVDVPLVTVDYAARAIACSAVRPTEHCQVAFYHVINGSQYPVERLVDVYKTITGGTFRVVDFEEWWKFLDQSLPTAVRSPGPSDSRSIPATDGVAADATTLPSLPRSYEALERYKMPPTSNQRISTAQLRDRLWRLKRHSSTPELYESLLQELTGEANTRAIDGAVAASLRWAKGLGKRNDEIMERGIRSPAAGKTASLLALRVWTISVIISLLLFFFIYSGPLTPAVPRQLDFNFTRYR